MCAIRTLSRPVLRVGNSYVGQQHLATPFQTTQSPIKSLPVNSVVDPESALYIRVGTENLRTEAKVRRHPGGVFCGDA